MFKADKMLFTSDMVQHNRNSSFKSADIYGVICSGEAIIKSKQYLPIDF